MTPTKILTEEHGLIRQFLDTLELALKRLEEGERVPVEFFEKALEFAQNFALKYHHFKEEYLMFGLLAKKRKGDIDAQVDTLRNQHERGRNYLAEIRGALQGYKTCDDDIRCEDIYSSTIIENLGAYIHLLRHHIHREDNIFYPAVDIELTEDEQKYLLEEFKKEEEKIGGAVLEKNRKAVIEIGSILEK